MEKKNTITNAQAMTALVSVLESMDDSTIAKTTGCELDQVATLRDKVAHMSEVANKPKTKTDTPSPATRAAIARAKQVEEAVLAAGKPVNWEYISERVTDMMTSQKVTAAMRKVLAWGKVERITVKGRVYYQAKTEEDSE